MEKTLISVPFSLINLLDSLSRIWKNVTLYSRVRQYTDLLSQTAGDKCTLFTTEENANAYLASVWGKSDVTACYPQWNNVPDGLEFYFGCTRSNWIL